MITFRTLTGVVALLLLLGLVDLVTGSRDLVYAGFWHFIGELATSPAAGAFAALIAAALVWEQSQGKREDDKVEADRKREDDKAEADRNRAKEADAAREERWWRSLQTVMSLEDKDRPMPEDPLVVLLEQLDPKKDSDRIKVVEHLIARSRVSLEEQNRALQSEVKTTRETALLLGDQLGEHPEDRDGTRRAALQHLKARQAELKMSLALGENDLESAEAAVTVAMEEAAEARSEIGVNDMNPADSNAKAVRAIRFINRAHDRRDDISARLESHRRELLFLDSLIPKLEEAEEKASRQP